MTTQIIQINESQLKYHGGCKSSGKKHLADDASDKQCARKRPAFTDITNATDSVVPTQKEILLSNKVEKRIKCKISDDENCFNVKDNTSFMISSLAEATSGDKSDSEVYYSSQESLESSDFSTDNQLPCKLSETLPPGVEDFDKECLDDPFSEPVYAMDIFNFYKNREPQFMLDGYMNRQEELSEGMRAVLVDWMSEVQQTFELNHETLYLGVKLVDHYLMRKTMAKTTLQLLGATCLLIACKYDERFPPTVNDFLLICDNAYTREQLLSLEMNVLKEMDFDLGIPLSYRFLRRFARCGKVSIEVLTLARYILESTLMEYEMMSELDSKMAASSLHLALRMKGETPEWTSCLEYYSGFKEEEILDLENRLNRLISEPTYKNLSAVKAKYSHSVFLEVAKIPSLPVN